MTRQPDRKTQWMIAVFVVAALAQIIFHIRPGEWTRWLGAPSFFVCLFVPGWLLNNHLDTIRLDPIARFTTSLLLGSALFLVAAFVGAVFCLGFVYVSIFAAVILLAVTLVAARKMPSHAATDAPTIGSNKWRFAFIITTMVIFVVTLKSGAPIDLSKDTLDHASFVSEILESDKAFPQTAFYAQDDENGRDIRKGLFHYLYAYSGRLVTGNALRILDIYAAICAVLLLLAVYTMSLSFTRDSRVATVASLLFLIGVAGGLESAAMRTSFYPNRFGLAFFFLFLVYAIQYLDGKRASSLIAVGFFGFAACATHILFAIVICAAGATTLAWKNCFPKLSWREHVNRTLRLGACTIAAILPYIAYRYVTASPQANELHTEVQAAALFNESFYISDPIRLGSWFGAIGVIALMTIVPLWRERSKHSGLGYAVASLLTIPLILLNPLVLPSLQRLITYLVTRLNLMTPFFLLPAFFMFWYIDRRRAKISHSRFSHALMLLLVLAIAVQLKPLITGTSFGREHRASENTRSYKKWPDGISFLNTIAEPIVVASDPTTSYSITATTKHRIVCTLDQHAPPNDSRLAERVTAAREILSPYVSMTRTIERLAQFDVTYVVLNKRLSAPSGHYWSIPLIGPPIDEKFANPAFELAYDAPDFKVWRWLRSGSEATDAVVATRSIKQIPDRAVLFNQKAGEADLNAFFVGESEVQRGARLTIGLVWSVQQQHELGNYTVVFRFNHTNPALPFAGKPFPKIARKLKEAVMGRRYRFRNEHKIQAGLLSPDTWTPGELIMDQSEVPIPLDLVPGEYEVSVKMLRVANLPNYYVHDLLFDNDVYQGVVLSRVTVR